MRMNENEPDGKSRRRRWTREAEQVGGVSREGSSDWIVFMRKHGSS